MKLQISRHIKVVKEVEINTENKTLSDTQLLGRINIEIENMTHQATEAIRKLDGFTRESGTVHKTTERKIID